MQTYIYLAYTFFFFCGESLPSSDGDSFMPSMVDMVDWYLISNFFSCPFLHCRNLMLETICIVIVMDINLVLPSIHFRFIKLKWGRDHISAVLVVFCRHNIGFSILPFQGLLKSIVGGKRQYGGSGNEGHGVVILGHHCKSTFVKTTVPEAAFLFPTSLLQVEIPAPLMNRWIFF